MELEIGWRLLSAVALVVIVALVGLWWHARETGVWR